VGIGVALIALVLLMALPGEESAEPGEIGATLPSQTERIRMLEEGVFPAWQSGSVERLREIHEEALELSAHATATRAAELALRLDGRLAWAHQSLGHVRFTGEGLPQEVQFPTADWETLSAAADVGWVSPEKFGELEAARLRFEAHRRKIASDPRYRNVHLARAEAAKHVVLSDLEYETLEAGPWLLFVQKCESERKNRDAVARARKKAALLKTLYRTFRSLYGDRVGLPPLEEHVVMRVWIFAERQSFDRYLATVEAPKARPSCCVYHPKSRWLAISPDAFHGTGNPPGQVLDDNFSLQEATKQLLHHVRKSLLTQETGRAVDWSDPRLWSRSHWLREGLAEYLGTARTKDESWELCQRNYYRIRPWQRLRTRLVREWGLPELLEVRGARDLEEAELRNPWAGTLFCGQSWALVYFLQHGAEGKYAERFLGYMDRELHGRTGSRVFCEAFGLDRVEGSELEREFHQWCGGILGR
jgi:hypothetical protein